MHTFPLSTSAPRARDAVRHETRRRTLTVLRRQEVPGGLVRLTLGGDDLAGFTSLGPEDHVKLFVPGPDGALVGRDYTPSEFRPLGASSGPELDLDVVVHVGAAGPASDWLRVPRPAGRSRSAARAARSWPPTASATRC